MPGDHVETGENAVITRSLRQRAAVLGEGAGDAPTTQTDQQLLDIFSRGGNTAVSILMTRYEGFLQYQCRRLTGGNADDAKDLFSLVLLKVYTEQPEHLKKVRHLGAWLSRIAQNKSIDLQRERMAAERRDQNLFYLRDSLCALPSSPEDTLLNQELLQQIQHAFDALPPRLRPAAELRFVEDADYETISRRLGISQVNARKRVQEARKRLIAALHRYLEGGRHTPLQLHGGLAPDSGSSDAEMDPFLF